MEKKNDDSPTAPSDAALADEKSATPASKPRLRGKKRKRQDSESSTDIEDGLPENALEVERNVQSAALKNNLDEASVKKILKKVVTNDHVLALVKLREEEENAAGKKENPPKLTRSKAKELRGASPNSAPWNIELTPIKHIPVKTRPEVEQLITKELPEDEDDDEYQPAHDDVPSDDDQTLETCSDIDSQPATPATPHSLHTSSPVVVKDGPFKVPPAGATTPARRKLIIEEEATIALRTRSKLSLSATPIEHIESSFVPPDDVPTPIGDDLWNQFLEECLNPAETSKNEDDDDADPEYNVAADPDAHDEDEEALENSIVRISKKELNDLVTELFNIMPADAVVDIAEDIADIDPTISPWDGKQEPLSDEEKDKSETCDTKKDCSRLSIGKSEPGDTDTDEEEKDAQSNEKEEEKDDNTNKRTTQEAVKTTDSQGKRVSGSKVAVLVSEQCVEVLPPAQSLPAMPRLLQRVQGAAHTRTHVSMDPTVKILPEQMLLLQQQLRQHIQLAASNYLQLFVNPAHWAMAPTYKEYLEQFSKMVEANPKSVVNVCNLKPALELCNSWEETVSEDNDQNKELIDFVQKEADRGRKRFFQNHLYVGNFPELFMEVIANSTVFQYPYLLPAMPYRADNNRRFGYRRSEDELIAMGLDQFWQYIDDNPTLFPKPRNVQGRWGLVAACNLVSKHMLPWISSKWLQSHIARVRKCKDNPISKFFEDRTITPVEHMLLPINPQLTLYEQPADEMPRIWIRHLAKTSKRFKYYYYKRPYSGVPASGVPLTVNVEQPKKNPLPIDFNKEIICYRGNISNEEPVQLHDKFDMEVVAEKPKGPMLTINPMTSNINEIITVKTESDPLYSGIMAAPASSKVTTMLNDRNEVTGSLIPVCISKLTQQKQNVVDMKSTKNYFKVVQTSLGAYLVPLNTQKNTNTVDSITVPISSTAESTLLGNDLPESSKSPAVEITEKQHKRKEKPIEKQHCQCCFLLKKICKEKQSRITDFFRAKKTDETPCECMYRKFPTISRKFRMLLSSFKSRSWCEQRRIKSKLNSTEETNNGQEKQSVIVDDEECSLQDIEYVTTYHMKLTRRLTSVHNKNKSPSIEKMFSNFDPDVHNPVVFTKQLADACGVELRDLYTEFMGFLTPEQADEIDRFKEHFIHNCIGDLVKRVETEIQDKNNRESILNHLNGIFTDTLSTSCEICIGILEKLMQYPRLAKHVFSLFPHNVVIRETESIESQSEDSDPEDPEPGRLEIILQDNETINTDDDKRKQIEESRENQGARETLIVMDYDSDETLCDENAEQQQINAAQETLIDEAAEVKDEVADDIDIDETSVEESIINKTTPAPHNTSGSSEMSPLFMSEDEPLPIQTETIKTESPEWTREEDKNILETLLEYITKQERKEKPILEILDEKNVYQIISDKFPDRCIDDVRRRVMHILEILVACDL